MISKHPDEAEALAREAKAKPTDRLQYTSRDQADLISWIGSKGSTKFSNPPGEATHRGRTAKFKDQDKAGVLNISYEAETMKDSLTSLVVAVVSPEKTRAGILQHSRG